MDHIHTVAWKPHKVAALASLIILALILAARRIREAVLDFAARQLADELGGNGPHGDFPFVPDDLKVSVFHARVDDTGAQ